MVITSMHSASSAGMASDASEISDEGSSPVSTGSGGIAVNHSCNVSSASAFDIGDICRDYLRNVCKRGKRCKFRHPDSGEARQLGRRQEYTFCHDFQNSGCRRASCRFIHCTREEEDYYKQTGQLPVRLQQAAALGIGVVPNDLPLMKGEIPICKDFLKGDCKRGVRCKFRHINPTQYDVELRSPDQVRTTRMPGVAEKFETFSEDSYVTDRFEPAKYANPYENAFKKRRAEDVFTEDIQYNIRTTLHAPAPITAADYRLLEEENTVLRRKVEELKKQVSDLVATNEVLLEQNARYRSSKAVASTAAGAIVTVSQVVVTPSITPARSAMPPIAAAQPINPLSTTVNTLPQLRLDVANSEMIISQQALQPRLAPELAQQGANLNNLNPAVSVSMNTLVPVSIGMDSIAPPVCSIAPTVSLVESLPLPTPVSLSQQPPSSMNAAMLPGQTNNTATLVSYPIMSHSLTPAQIQPNSSSLG